jgi:hypothetical protein
MWTGLMWLRIAKISVISYYMKCCEFIFFSLVSVHFQEEKSCMGLVS